MKVFDLAGRQHTLSLQGYQVLNDDTRPRSTNHLRCRYLLKRLYPLDLVCEEVPIPGEHLFLDFFIPSRKMVIEVQGPQHSEYIPYFHKGKTDFWKGQKCDRRKLEWCQVNNLKLIELLYSETDVEWTKKLKKN